MQRLIEKNEKTDYPFGIRSSVWCIIFGFVLVCAIAIWLSRPHVSQPTATTPQEVTREIAAESSPSNATPAADESLMAREQVRVIESELTKAKAELETLRVRLTDKHPRVQVQLQKIAELEKRLKQTQ